MSTPLRNGKASSSALLGTPLPPRERSTGAPSPSPSIMSRYNKSSGLNGAVRATSIDTSSVVVSRGEQSRRTLIDIRTTFALANPPWRFTRRQEASSSPQKAPHAESSLISGAERSTTATSTVAASEYENSIIEHAQPTPRPATASAASAPTRIVADPSIATTFRKEDDPELYDLFLR